jgi:Acyl-CoA dehydrogenase, C-terminal domain
MVLRTLIATTKMVVCKVGIVLMFELMEALGVVGYMDEPDESEFNTARLMRDTAANMVWEGTTNVLSSEVARHVTNGRNRDVFAGWLERSITSIQDIRLNSALKDAWSLLGDRLTEGQGDLSATLADGRQIMFSLAWIVSGMLLSLDAQRDESEVAV